MSRVGKMPITVPKGAEVKLDGSTATVKGPLGTLTQSFSSSVTITQVGDQLQVNPVDDSRAARANHGTVRAVLNNMIKGVVSGFEKKLTLVGVGYRAQAQGDKLNLSLGFSHPVVYEMPAGIKVETPTQNEVLIKGADRQRVGQVSAEIRAYRSPEPYKGKGVRYSDEVVVIKETKKK